MAKKLNPDGLPEDVPSMLPKKKTDLFRDLDITSDEGRNPQNVPEEPPTRVAQGKMGRQPAADPLLHSSSEPKTRIALGARKPVQPPKSALQQETAADVPSDPVVGWVVIIHGPGEGRGLQLGAGQNTLGRGEKARVRINFGDDEISRDTHAILTYDPKHNKFYIQPGVGVNLTYLGDEPVLTATPLSHGDKIVLGSTTLRFIAFCDESFIWAD